MAAAARSGVAQERAARRPSDRWSAVQRDGTATLEVGGLSGLRCSVRQSAVVLSWRWEVGDDCQVIDSGKERMDRLDDAKLAAEDALLAVRDEIARAVGR